VLPLLRPPSPRGRRLGRPGPRAAAPDLFFEDQINSIQIKHKIEASDE
jgi:hypothetical protein